MKFLKILLAITVNSGFCLSIGTQAQTYTESTLYSFGVTNTDGDCPIGNLVMDSAENLYGVTYATTYNAIGGIPCANGAEGYGTVFKLTPGGTHTILHTFGGVGDGEYPNAGLAIDTSGNLYGITGSGGVYGYGIVFKISASGDYSILYNFGKVEGDGYNPAGPLTLDSAGNIYGSTNQGGNSKCKTASIGCGTLFELTPTGVETIIYKFAAGKDGRQPAGNLIRDGKGNLYGTADYSLFKVSSKGVETALYDFSSSSEIAISYLARNSAGNFYGGFTSADGDGSPGFWEVTNSGVETLSYAVPFNGPLMFSNGNLFGTGIIIEGTDAEAVYEFDPTTGIVNTLYTFPLPPYSDSWYQASGVIMDSAGNLYGTTGGAGTYGAGTVFKLTKN